jgi:hypothetical protein
MYSVILFDAMKAGWHGRGGLESFTDHFYSTKPFSLRSAFRESKRMVLRKEKRPHATLDGMQHNWAEICLQA